MTTSVVVRYTTRPEHADENERLIRAVFAELADTRPDGFRYVATRLSDGVSFLHVATLDGDVNPLNRSPAFATFLAGIGHRCVDPPVAAEGTAIGLYLSDR